MSTIFVKGNTELFCPSIFSVIQRAHQCHQPHDPAPHVWSRPQVPHPPSAHLHHVGWSPGPCVRYVSVQKLELFISCQTQHNITSVGLVFLAVWICTVNLTADRKITYLQNTLWGWAIILLATESCHTLCCNKRRHSPIIFNFFYFISSNPCNIIVVLYKTLI